MCHDVYRGLNEQSFRDTIAYYLEADAKEAKVLSNQGKVQLQGQPEPTDIGNFEYNVFLIMSMEMTSGSYKKGNLNLKTLHLLFVQLEEKWPSLEPKWAATTGSLIRKGDVVEVGLAMANLHVSRTWKTFVDVVEAFHDGLHDCINYICKCESGRFPTSTCLPNPCNFARLILFTWSGMRCHDDVARLQALQKADDEIAKLMVRIGSHNWNE